VAWVKKEIDRVWTLSFQAVGHEGIRFRPGQCVWVTINSSPFALAQHPFTIASSGAKPASGQPVKSFDLTIKELGDYTAQIGSVAVDSHAYVEGPYGAATVDVDGEAPAVFIVGGIGVTPAMSMMRTLRDLNSKRPLLLIYGCASEDRVIFREELEAMRDVLRLQIVYVLEEPADAWGGESGFITPALLAKHLVAPFDATQTQYFLCGPDAMMNTVEPALRDHGVPIHNINSERFQIV
jgi:predicted ferric reductase